MSLNSHRQSLLAYAALARGDREGAVAALRGDPRHFDSAATAPGADLRGHYGWTTLAFSAMRRAGLIDEAEAYARRVPSDATERGFWDGELAAARGDLEAAWRALESQIALYEAGLPSTLIAVNTLVDVYLQRGELQRADALLQRFHSLRATAYPMPGSRGLEWLRTRARAAGVLRRLGKHAEAEATERALRELLRFADSDLVLLPDTARRE